MLSVAYESRPPYTNKHIDTYTHRHTVIVHSTTGSVDFGVGKADRRKPLSSNVIPQDLS